MKQFQGSGRDRQFGGLGVDAFEGIAVTLDFFLRAIARAVDLPVILYNIPARSPRNMEASTTLRLAREVSNIVGVKEASANMKQIGEIIRDAPDGFRVWSGNDADILTIMALGGYGVVSVAAHLVDVVVHHPQHGVHVDRGNIVVVLDAGVVVRHQADVGEADAELTGERRLRVLRHVDDVPARRLEPA